MTSMIRDIKLAPSGHAKIDWVKRFMPVMAAADKEYSVTKPFAGIKMVITLHLEAKTAYMATIFKHAGADVAVTLLQRWWRKASTYLLGMVVPMRSMPNF